MEQMKRTQNIIDKIFKSLNETESGKEVLELLKQEAIKHHYTEEQWNNAKQGFIMFALYNLSQKSEDINKMICDDVWEALQEK